MRAGSSHADAGDDAMSENRLKEIRERTAAVDYRSPVFALYDTDIRYLLGLAESFEQRQAERELQHSAQLAVIEYVNKTLEREIADLKAALVTERISNGTLPTVNLDAEAQNGSPAGIGQTENGTGEQAAGSEEQAGLAPGAGSDLVAPDGSQEPNGGASGDSAESVSSNADG